MTQILVMLRHTGTIITKLDNEGNKELDATEGKISYKEMTAT